MGPFNAISSISHLQQWAHLWSLAVSVMSISGPIHGHQQFLQWARMGVFKDIGSFLICNNEPIHGYQQLFP
jgi:hypothetical protein